MNPRYVQKQLLTLLAQFPAVVLLGPRQTGKTTLALAEMARRGDAIYLDLELPSAQRQLDDPESFLLAQRNRLVILDEVQRLPELFAVLRGVIDIRRRDGEAAGQFLLLGSATGVLLQQASESLAGRVAQLELTPFQAREVLLADALGSALNSLWVRGGFPLSGCLSSRRSNSTVARGGRVLPRSYSENALTPPPKRRPASACFSPSFLRMARNDAASSLSTDAANASITEL